MVTAIENHLIYAKLDELYPTSKKLRAFRDTIPAITIFVCAIGFALSIFGYINTLPTIPSGVTGLGMTTTSVPVRSRCNWKMEQVFPRVDCSYKSHGQNEFFLVMYTIVYGIIAVSSGFSGPDSYAAQGFATGFLFLVTCIIAIAEVYLTPVLIPKFVVTVLLLVLVFLKKGSGNWFWLSTTIFRTRTHPDDFDYKKPQQARMVENFTGITIV